MKEAVELTQKAVPNIQCDGEMQADVAVNFFIREKLFNSSKIKNEPDILIFPELNSANISYKLLSQLGDASSIGPILTPLNHYSNIIQRTAPVSEIINISTLTALLHEESNK